MVALYRHDRRGTAYGAAAPSHPDRRACRRRRPGLRALDHDDGHSPPSISRRLSKRAGRRTASGGVAKGVGMIHPDMATMLSFIACDAEIPADFLQESLSKAVDLSFNMIDVDGDQSTNDTVLLFANGAAGGAGDNGRGLRRRGGVPRGADGGLHLSSQRASRRRRRRGAYHGGHCGRRDVGRRRPLRGARDFVFQPSQGDGSRQRPELGTDHDGAGQERH